MDASFGADVMHYTRTFSRSVNGESVRVVDTAHNQSTFSRSVTLGIDNVAPVVSVSKLGDTIYLNVSDNVSRIWKTTSAPSGSINNGGVIYKVVPKSDASVAFYDENCGIISPMYDLITDASAQESYQVPITGVQLSQNVILYCVKDNAGNVTR